MRDLEIARAARRQSRAATLPRGQRDAERGGDADRRRAADHQRADRVGHVLPASRRPARPPRPGSRRLVEQDQPVVLPANGRDHERRRGLRAAWTARAARGSGCGVRPATRTSLSRAAGAVRDSSTAEATQARAERRPAARPRPRWPRRPPAARRTRTRAAVVPPADDLVARRARGWTRTAQRALLQPTPSSVARPIASSSCVEQPLVAVERERQLLRRPGAAVAERLDLARGAWPPRCAPPPSPSRRAARPRARSAPPRAWPPSFISSASRWRGHERVLQDCARARSTPRGRSSVARPAAP